MIPQLRTPDLNQRVKKFLFTRLCLLGEELDFATKNQEHDFLLQNHGKKTRKAIWLTNACTE